MPTYTGSAEIIVSQAIHDQDQISSITQLANGNVVVVYYGADQVPGTTDWLEGEVYARVFNAAGNPIGNEFQVNTSTADDQIGGNITALNDGGFVITWTTSTIPDQLEENNNGTIENGGTTWMQHYDSHGNPVGGETAVGASSDVFTLPSIVQLSDGNIVVYTFTYDQNFNQLIQAQTFAPDLTPVGKPVTLPTNAFYPPNSIQVIDGHVVATYGDGDAKVIDLGTDGVTVGQSITANTYTTGYQGSTQLAVLKDGSVVVTWQSNLQDGSNYGVFAQHASADGTPIGGEVQVNTYTTLSQYNPHITALDDGGYVIVWTSNGEDGDKYGIYGQVYDAQGNPSGDEMHISLQSTGSQTNALVEAIPGGFVVTYMNQDDQGVYKIAERVFTIPHDQVLTGDDTANTLLGGSGNDTISGLGGNDALYGGSGNDMIDGGTGADKMYGGDGNDTYVVDSSGDAVSETSALGDAGGIDTVMSSVSFQLTNYLENLTLTGGANINGTGNALDNTLTGNDGNNLLNGLTGADHMSGGAGNDTYVVDNAGDTVSETRADGSDAGGTDIVQASVGFTLGAYIENLLLTGAGNISGTGNDLVNTITGNAGNNWLDGGAGADRLVGGLGDDTYVVDDAHDVVIEGANAGTDMVQSSISWALGANLEQLTLTGSADINGIGNALDNLIYGNTGNNVLNGQGGADAMSGGAGDDTYYVDNPGDTVWESANEGHDRVVSSVSFTLSANVEDLVLTGTADLSGTGNDLSNTIYGNSGNNVIDGGAGADHMIGGAGDDTYYVDNAGDTVAEAASGGHDTIMASVSYSLAGIYVENLTLTGSDDLNATGNGMANVLTGNDGNNRIDGGAGADAMSGGAGDDTYIVDNAGDTVTENTASGTDEVQARISFTLGDNVENLVLTGGAVINGTGNGLDNHLTGNNAANKLDGGDGNDVLRGMGGNDTLTGGNGADTFVFDHFGVANGVDHIVDFVSGVDMLAFTAADYGFEAGHQLTTAEFHVNGRVGTNGQFVYNTTSHTLYWDSDGTGSAAPVAIAVLDNVATLHTSDFLFT